MRGFYIFHFVYIYESERRTAKAVLNIKLKNLVNKFRSNKMKKVISMVAMIVLMNAAVAMAASDLESYNRQDVTFRDGKSQIELMGDKHTDSEKIDPAKAGIRV